MDIKEKISKVMKQAVDHCEVMGVNLLVEKGGEELLYCEEGMADRENRRLISRDTIFRLYSQTKPVTAASAMILMERGHQGWFIRMIVRNREKQWIRYLQKPATVWIQRDL